MFIFVYHLNIFTMVMLSRKGRPKKVKEDLLSPIYIRIEPWVLEGLKALWSIDKVSRGNDRLKFSLWLRGILYKELERRKVEVEVYLSVLKEYNERGG